MKKYNKITVGFVIQEYQQVNGKYVCSGQSFVAGDQVDYEDSNGEVIMIDTSQETYYPFDMKQPLTVGGGLKFVCPSCGGNRLECVQDGSHTSEVVNIDPDGDFEYDAIQSTGDVDRWQCLKCGYTLVDGDDNPADDAIIDQMDIIEWIKKNCSQE